MMLMFNEAHLKVKMPIDFNVAVSSFAIFSVLTKRRIPYFQNVLITDNFRCKVHNTCCEGSMSIRGGL